MADRIDFTGPKVDFIGLNSDILAIVYISLAFKILEL